MHHHRTKAVPLYRLAVALTVTALLGSASAFVWTPFEFPAGSQRYTLEISTGGEDAQVITLDIDIAENGGLYDATTTMTVSQTGLEQSSLGDSAFGGSALGMMAFGPMMLFGPSFMMLPMMLGQEDIHVRQEPIRIMGMGSLYMETTSEVAGHECVDIRLVMDQNADEAVEFGLAEGLPFPCYSRFGQGDDAVEVRLVRAEY